MPIPKEKPVATADPVAAPPPAPGISIDAARLARTQRETAAVSELLANIFEEEQTLSPVETPVASAANKASFEGLVSEPECAGSNSISFAAAICPPKPGPDLTIVGPGNSFKVRRSGRQVNGAEPPFRVVAGQVMVPGMKQRTCG